MSAVTDQHLRGVSIDVEDAYLIQVEPLLRSFIEAVEQFCRVGGTHPTGLTSPHR